MGRRITKATSIFAAILVLSTMLSGCGSKTGNNQESSGNQVTQDTSGIQAVKTTSQDNQSNLVYPIKTDAIIKYWVVLNGNVASQYTNLGETPYAKELARQTGITVEYIHPASGQEQDSLNLMLASSDLPDIIEWDFNGKFNGGAENAINQGYILSLNDVIDKYCPNLNELLQQNPDFGKYMKTDSGIMFAFPMIRDPENSEIVLSTEGPIIRKDWLDDLGLQIPTTIDEWETALKAFRDKKGATAPLTRNGIDSFLIEGYFISDYVKTKDFYHEGDVVKLGYLEPQYKDAIGLLSRWYKDGILDNNVFSVDPKIRDANMLTGKSGASIGYGNSHLATWNATAQKDNPKYELVGAVNPTIKKGDKAKYGSLTATVDTAFGSICATSKNVEIAARLLDYGYSKEGILLMNYGIENESYKLVDGKPEYTEFITNNPEKVTVSKMRAQYTRCVYSAPSIQYGIRQIMNPTVLDAFQKWHNTDAGEYKLFGLTATAEEATELAKLESDINTYHDEMVTKFILGIEPISNFEKFQEQLKVMGAERILQMKQAQYDRFLKR